MARSRDSSRRKAVKESNDLISNMPELVIAKILKRLPLHQTAEMSTLSRTWRHNWLSCNYLMFDYSFWINFRKDEIYDWKKGSSVINKILFHHNGCIHSFLLELRPSGLLVENNESLSQWLSFLSRSCPQKIALLNSINEWSDLVSMPSYIFQCTEVTKLHLRCFILYAPPFNFKDFPCLRTLKLVCIELKHGFHMLWELVAKCPSLVCLWLENCVGMDHLEIDAPSLEKLTIKGHLDYLSLKNCPRLVDVSLSSKKPELNGNEIVVATVKSLATSYKMQCLAIEGSLCKFLAASGINKSLPSAFNHLSKLCLTGLMLNDPDVLYFTISMIESCPFVKELLISVSPNTVVGQQKYEYFSDNYNMLGMLHEVKITGITGSVAEMKLIEYVLGVSAVLKNLMFKCAALMYVPEVTKKLFGLPRASPKSRVICLNNYS